MTQLLTTSDMAHALAPSDPSELLRMLSTGLVSCLFNAPRGGTPSFLQARMYMSTVISGSRDVWRCSAVDARDVDSLDGVKLSSDRNPAHTQVALTLVNANLS